MPKTFAKYLIIVSAIIILVGCQDMNPYNCSLDEQVLSFNDSIMNRDDFKEGFERILNTVDEPDMEQCATKTFRLMNSHSWDFDIWSYRFEKQSDGGLLTIKKTYTESYKEFEGVNDTTIIRNLTTKEWEEIEKAFESNCFWTMQIGIDRRGLDGGMYWLEAYDPSAVNPVEKEYFAAARWSPEKGTAFNNICNIIFEIAYTE
jgi:hypothetical protein